MLDTALLNKNDDDDEKNNALHSRLKKITTQQHFFCTVKLYELLHKCDMLKKILTSFCIKITTLFRDIEVQNLHFNVTDGP